MARPRFPRLHWKYSAVLAIATLNTPKIFASVLFDDISAYESKTNGASLITTNSPTNTFMGDAYQLTNGASDITGMDLLPANLTGRNYSGLQLSIYIWANVNTGTVNSSAPAFSMELGSYAFNSTGNYSTGSYYPFESSPPGSSPDIIFKTPFELNGLTTVGITINVEGTTNGITYQNANNLNSVISYGVAPTVGGEIFNGYYRNANLETNGNFTSTLRTLGYSDQSLALRVFGDIAPASEQWTSSAGGNWSMPSSWNASLIPAASTNAIFNSGSANDVANISSGTFCNCLSIGSDNVTLNLTGSAAMFTANSSIVVGENTAANVSVSSYLDLTNSYGGTLNVSTGSVTCGQNESTGLLTIGNGVKLISTTAVAIAANSSIIMSIGSKLVTPSLLVAGSVNSWTGLLDIGTGALDFSSADLATISNQIEQGCAGGTWNGSGGITSSAAANDSSHLTAVGVILNNNGNGSTLYGTNGSLEKSFGGNNSGLNDVLIRYTYFGDANLDGKVDGSDYSLIDNGSLNNLTGWYNGDFNYDGVVNGSDYTLMDNAFNQQGMPLTSIFGINSVDPTEIEASSIPEPKTMTIIIVISILIAGKRAPLKKRFR